MSDKLSTSYNKVIRRNGKLKLKVKDKSSGESRMLSLKKSIDKKAKNKKLKAKKLKHDKKKKNKFDKYKSAEQLLDERVKKKHDKFAWF